MLITNRHSVYFGHFMYSVRLVYFSPLRSTSVQVCPFGLLHSIQSNSVQLVYFGLFRSIRSVSVNFDYFGPLHLIRSIQVQFGSSRTLQTIQSIWSNLVHSVYSVHLVYFRSLWSYSVYLLKNEKIKSLVESTINYLSNINCNYTLSFVIIIIFLRE